MEELAKAIAAAVAPIAPRWVTATVARVTRARSGNVFLALEGEHTTIDAVVFAGAKVGPIPERGDVIAAHVARVSLYQARGQMSLVIDRLGLPDATAVAECHHRPSPTLARRLLASRPRELRRP